LHIELLGAQSPSDAHGDPIIPSVQSGTPKTMTHASVAVHCP
jgi:hypothetical protein